MLHLIDSMPGFVHRLLAAWKQPFVGGRELEQDCGRQLVAAGATRLIEENSGGVVPAPRRLPWLICAALAGQACAAAAPIDFTRDVLPILSDTCFQCHGPDEAARKAKLRLDQREGLFRTRDGVTVVAPRDPDASELILRITSREEDEIMPPPEAKRRLKPEEVALLKRWVKEGAAWAGHWAFEPMQRDRPPADPRHPNIIDGFIGARLAAEKLEFAPEADRARLLRRVTFDLTGLPPSPAEIAAFEADRAPGAYERVVDRLLASPRYGERMATDWLDVARYADTHGYQMDRPRAMWAWRDWVIGAFNDNLPFDQFVTWQLAGDLLPDATKQQRLATGFNRLHNQNEEGGVVEEEYRVAYVADRVTTFGTAFLGLTLDCARCHDHKFDPITQRDFYALASFFQNIDEAGQISFRGFADAMPVPTMLLTTDEQDRRLLALRTGIAALEQEVASARAAAEPAFDVWLADRNRTALPTIPAGLVAHIDFESVDGERVPNRTEPAKSGKLVDAPAIVPSSRGNVAELHGDDGFVFPGVGDFKRTDPFTFGIWVQPPAKPADRAVVLHHSKAPVDAGSRGYELLLEEGRVAFGLHYLWPAGSLKVVSRTALAGEAWAHVAVTYDGSSRAAGVRIYINGEPVPLEAVRDGLFKDITYAGDEPPLAIGHRFRDKGFVGGRVDDLMIFGRELTPLEVAQLAGRDDFARVLSTPAADLSARQWKELFDYYAERECGPVHAALARLRAAREAQNALVMSVPEAMVMQELPQPRPAFILERGAYDAPRAQVTADTPAVLPPFPAGLPRNRLGLARWLMDPEHPLLARVTVNRFWQQMFGRGLVETSDNFGRQGTPPSHPELLDALARGFIAGGWDVKRLLRLIATSRTYRQSSHGAPGAAARDPANVWLARGPARRLTGEMLRDQTLSAGGLLVEKLGGPPVKPYQPPGLWEEIAMGRPKYEQGTGEELYRRSLYTFWKRTVPPPAMMIFDASERNVCTVRRQTTSTPLQALAALNDVQWVEAARALGERMLREGGATLDARLAWGFRLVNSRPAAPAELAILRRLYGEQHAMFAADLVAAEKLMCVGESPADPTLPVVERAAATIVAQALLNCDEALMRR